jgi:hypothetical protein
MKNKAIQIFKVYQKNNQPSFGTGQSETFYMKVINLDDKYFSAILDSPELERVLNFIGDIHLSEWSFTCFYIEVDGVFYQTEEIHIDKSLNNLNFYYFDKFNQNPFNVKW